MLDSQVMLEYLSIMFNDAKILNLADVSEISAGYPLRTSVDGLEPGDAHLVQLRDVTPEAGVKWSGVKQVTLPSKKQPVWLRSSDVIFSARGTRNLAYALEGLPAQTVCAPQFFVIRPNDPNLDPTFLALSLIHI